MMIGLCWLLEELAISRIVHDLASLAMLVGLRDPGDRIVPTLRRAAE